MMRGKSMKRRLWLCGFAFLMAQSPCAADVLTIKWGDAIDLGPGGHARVHRLRDGRFMAAYSAGGGVVARFASPKNLRDWGESVVVARDFTATNGSAPYIVATKNYILLSWHETPLPGDPSATSVARVAAVPKREITDGRFTTMRGESTPPGMVFGRDRGLWNSLCPLDGDRFLLVTEQNGRITLYPGSVREE